jgi:phosphoenolpyruvate synthase/pyruvate phosphate dikinase
MIATGTRWSLDFAEGSRHMRELLGGKGAGIAEMTRVLGPDLVPAGFTITTEACVAYMRDGDDPAGFAGTWARHFAGSRTAPGDASATPRIRCCCPSAAGRATRCRA